MLVRSFVTENKTKTSSLYCSDETCDVSSRLFSTLLAKRWRLADPKQDKVFVSLQFLNISSQTFRSVRSSLSTFSRHHTEMHSMDETGLFDTVALQSQ